MDYEFSLDEYNQPLAKFSLGHEALGRWFSEELRSDQHAITELLDVIQQLEQRSTYSHKIMGPEFQLRFQQHEVEVLALSLGIDIDEELPEDTDLYDAESYSECGLHDFKQALLSWQDYLRL